MFMLYLHIKDAPIIVEVHVDVHTAHPGGAQRAAADSRPRASRC